MSDELKLLNAVFSGSCTEAELSQIVSPLLIRSMKKNGFLLSRDSGSFSLTSSGIQRRLQLLDQLSAEERLLHQEVAQESQRQSQAKREHLFQLLLVFVGWVLGLLTAAFTHFLDRLF